MRMFMVGCCLLVSSGCAVLDGTHTGPDGSTTEVHYRGFLRDYSVTFDKKKDGELQAQVGAKSDTQAAGELLGAAVGAATTLMSKGVVP